MVETGSGLIILDPVDISGGYTSVKEKTNMSLTSTDIYMHLSLSALSLLLNLQSQVTGALQSGNAIPLASCTNFHRIWVSPKGMASVTLGAFFLVWPHDLLFVYLVTDCIR